MVVTAVIDGERRVTRLWTEDAEKVDAALVINEGAGGVLRDGYDTGGFYDEAFERDSDGAVVPRAHYAELIAQIASMDGPDLRRATELANRSVLHRGVTFTVYSEGEQGAERILPFDPIPRILPADEWAVVETGLRQRIRALNRFLHDVYHDAKILKDGADPDIWGFDGGPLWMRNAKQKRGEPIAKGTIGAADSYSAYGMCWANVGNTPFRMYKHFTHEGGIASPMISVAASSSSHRIVTSTNVPPRAMSTAFASAAITPSMVACEASTAATIDPIIPVFSTWRPFSALGSSGTSMTSIVQLRP